MNKQIALLPAAAALLLSTGCAVAKAPNHLLSVDATPVSFGTEADFPVNPNPDYNTKGLRSTYEFLPFGENGNVALTYQFRAHELDLPASPSIATSTVKAGPRWHWQLDDNLTWFVGPAIGITFGIDSDPFPIPPGPVLRRRYQASLYLDAEVGGRWWIADSFGIEGLVNYSSVRLQGTGLNPNLDLDGFTLTGGVFVDF